MNRRLLFRLAALGLVILFPTLAAAQAEAVTKDAPAETVALPSLDDLMTRLIESSGGEKAIRAHESRVTRGTFSMVEMGLSGKLTLYQAAPNRMLQEVELEGIGTERGGFNGEVAWQLSNMAGPMVLDGPAKAEMARQGDFYFELNIQDHYATMEVVAATTFADQECFQVSAATADGKEESFYFSAESGHLVGHEGTMSTGMGEVKASTRFSDFQETDGITIPMSLTTSVMGQTQLITVESVSHEPVDETVFALPEEIAVMAKPAEEKSQQ